jgi:hypothetical protein
VEQPVKADTSINSTNNRAFWKIGKGTAGRILITPLKAKGNHGDRKSVIREIRPGIYPAGKLVKSFNLLHGGNERKKIFHSQVNLGPDPAFSVKHEKRNLKVQGK